MKLNFLVALLSNTSAMLSICYFYTITVLIILLSLQIVDSMSMINKHSYFMDASNANNDVVDIIVSKGYLPNEKDLPKTSVVKSTVNDVTYLLSKLSDEELIKLLNDNPKKNEYDLNDIVKLAFDSKLIQDSKLKSDMAETRPRDDINEFENQNGLNKKRFPEKSKPQIAVFKLDNKPVDPYSVKPDGDMNYYAIQKLSNMLYSRPLEIDRDEKNNEDEKKELLFDVLVSQLKTLCCKTSKTSMKSNSQIYQQLSNDFLPLNLMHNPHSQDQKLVMNEHMFLIVNDELKTNGSDELISVDPDSLERNSSVLLLGPITTPLTDNQLKLVMFRISSELSKPEYIPLLQQLSDGTLSGNNVKLMKSLVTGPETRRYIKPHRCNHQSRLARVYGGPKWLICTGYLNINTPSLYD